MLSLIYWEICCKSLVMRLNDTKGGYDVLQSAVTKHETIKSFSGNVGYPNTSVELVEKVLSLKLHISKKTKIPLPYCRSAGSSSAHSPGLVITGIFPRITKSLPVLPKKYGAHRHATDHGRQMCMRSNQTAS
uniref:Uncharacterized protein n=1 Tax=Candidatus Kentrum sp. FW TaxID=2126338 RepID=A0A450TCK9_9GAMM|nr:MAG: hypothetical protein BECKFW1821C_GA0114237_100629 [Candidatus Kentron sp. FW]